MGKTPESKRLVIYVDEEWIKRPEIRELEEKGHKIYLVPVMGNDKADLILSRAAWNWHDDMWPMLETALKAARKAKKK